MSFILGKKIEMTQIWKDDKVIPCTLVSAGPCFVLQIKNKENDGYEAIQVGYEKKTKNIKKPEKGKEYRYLREFKVQPARNASQGDVGGGLEFKVGDNVDVSVFKEGDIVKVAGISKGKGFQGAVKKWGFKGRNQTHGVKHEHRTLGSVGSSGPGRVFPGRKMPGRMGAERVTVKNLEVVKVDAQNNLIAIKGAIPGRRGTILEIRS